MEIIMQTRVTGSGRNTKYSAVPTDETCRFLQARGFKAELVNVAPRGGAWGATLQVPAREADKAKRALSGESVYASLKLKAAAEREIKKRAKSKAEAEKNVISKEVMCHSIDGSEAIKFYAPQGFVKRSERVIVDRDAVDRDAFTIQDNGYLFVDVKKVKVKSFKRNFSAHAEHGNAPPELMAEIAGPLILMHLAENAIISLPDTGAMRIYASRSKIYVVKEK